MQNADREPEKQIRVKTLMIGGLVAVLFLVWITWWQQDRLLDAVCRPLVDEALASRSDVDAGTLGSLPPDSEALDARAASVLDVERQWSSILGQNPLWPEQLGEPGDCERVEQNLLALCREIDSRPWVQERLSGGSCALLRQVAGALAENPPVLSAELKSYPAILANAFHVSRTVGIRRARLLSELISRERGLAEPSAMIVFEWLVSRERCGADRGPVIRPEQLYDYAGFLTQTLGGQAYLRRRAPVVEALTTFYAMVILEQAVQRDFNPQGIDPRADLARSRALLADEPLVFRERYLGVLDEMSGRWERRAGAP